MHLQQSHGIIIIFTYLKFGGHMQEKAIFMNLYSYQKLSIIISQ